MEGELTISVTKDNKTSMIFALATDGEEYFLIDCYQSFLGNFFFPLYWVCPLTLIKLTKSEFENLSFTAEQTSLNNSFSFKPILSSLFGLAIGHSLYNILDQLTIFQEKPFTLFFIAVIVVIILRKLYHQKIKSQLLLNDSNTIQIRLNPKDIVWRHLGIFLVFLLIVFSSGWLFIHYRHGVTWIIFIIGQLIYSLQSKLGFLPGLYRTSRVHKRSHND